MSPHERNHSYLLATSLLELTRGPNGWMTGDGEPVGEFNPTTELRHAQRVVARMEELGFAFEIRSVDDVGSGNGALVSFFRESETYSAMAGSECEAICVAAARFVMHRAGEAAAIEDPPARATGARARGK
jgi:hypothetical protein